jgi:hypothetical protein
MERWREGEGEGEEGERSPLRAAVKLVREWTVISDIPTQDDVGVVILVKCRLAILCCRDSLGAWRPVVSMVRLER